MNPHHPLFDFALALGLGALVGIERERKKAQDMEAGIGGLRTFILLSLTGAVGAWLSAKTGAHWIFAGTGIGVCGVLACGYTLHAWSARDFGATTEVAAVLTYLLGGMALYGEQALAAALAVATAAVLAYKRPLHVLAEKIGPEDLHAGLRLLLATFVVLPVLPNRTVDPWGALNPYKMWWLVILISGLSLAGYVVSRWLGPGRGLPLTGFFGGLVSSTAVSLSFARRSREEPAETPGLAEALAGGLLLSWVVMFARILVAVAVVNFGLLRPLLTPMLAMGLTSLAAAAYFCWRSARSPARPAATVPLKNPFSLTSAIKFALLFAAVLLLVKVVEQSFSGRGLYVLAGLAGLTDVDAITLSMASQARQSGDSTLAVHAITLAVVSNTLVKCGLVVGLGAGGIRSRVTLSTLALLAAALLALFL